MRPSEYSKGYRNGMQDIADMINASKSAGRTSANDCADTLEAIERWVRNNGAHVTEDQSV